MATKASSTGLNTLPLATLRRILELTWRDDRAHDPVLITGVPGCGKSTMVADLAAELNIPLEVVMANIAEPSDFSGLPILNGPEHDRTVKFAPPEWARRIAGKHAVLFLDEINTARPATTAALLRVVLDRKVGELDLGPNVHIVAAMNPSDQAAHGWELPPALANRFKHYNVAPMSHADWLGWISAKFNDRIAAMAACLEGIPLNEEPTSGAFASPRAWTAALASADMLEQAGEPELAISAIAAAVGPGNAIAFRTARADRISSPDELATVDRARRATKSAMAKLVAANATPDEQSAAVARLVQIYAQHPSIVYIACTENRSALTQLKTVKGMDALIKCLKDAAPTAPKAAK